MNEEFLQWLNDQDEYWIEDKRVEEEFPNLDVELIGVTKQMNSDGNLETPKRDWRQAVKYGGVMD